MQVRMKSTRLGSPDGIKTVRYMVGQSYTLPDSLGQSFIEEGWAEAIPEKAEIPKRPRLQQKTKEYSA